MPPRQNLPAWQRNSRFLDEVAGLRNPLQLLEADSHEPEVMEQAIKAWSAIDPAVKEYINARISYNLLVGVDELRRRLDRGNNHLSNIRTGTRLTAERIETLNRAESFSETEDEDEDEDFIEFGDEEDFDEVDEDDMPPIPMAIDREPNDPFTDDDEAELAEAFLGLDESPGGVFVAQEPEPEPPVQAQASKRKASPRKRKASAKKASSRKSSDKDNGVGTSVEVLDENGTPLQPTA